MYNIYEGRANRVLFVCSAGILRSPTAAKIAWQEYGWNTRAAGAYGEYALIPVSASLISWADDIFCMEEEHKKYLADKFKGLHPETKITVLNIPDNFAYMDEELVKIIKHRLSLPKDILNA